MKKRYLTRGILLLLLLAMIAVLAIPGSPVYLPELIVPGDLHEGRSARNWSKDLDSPDAEVRSEAAFALGAIGDPAKNSVPTLATLLREDPDANVRAAIALALSKMHRVAQEAVSALSTALGDAEPLVRMNSALALRNMGPKARETVPALLAGLHEDHNQVYTDRFVHTVQDMMALALGKITAGTDEAVAGLMEALRSARTNATRLAIIRAIGDIGSAAKDAGPLLQEYKADKNQGVREAAENALKKIGIIEAVAFISAGPALAELPVQDREYLWDIEHHGNVLSKFGFGPWATALRDGDRAAIDRIFADNFSGTVVIDPEPVRVVAAFASAERTNLADRSPSSLDRKAFVSRLMEFREPFAASRPQVKFSLISLHPQTRGNLSGPWEGTAQLRLAGEHAPGAPAETHVSLRFEITQLTEQTLARPGWLRGAAVLQTSVVRSPRYLFAEVAKARGLDPDRVHDNWTSDPLLTNTGGVYVCDFNRDGYLDVLVTDTNGVTLYRGRTGGTFEDATVACGLPDPRKPSGLQVAAWVDIDGDGWDDLLLGGRVYHNEKGTRFSDVTRRCNLRLPEDATAVIVADYDRDGKLDLYVTRTGRPQSGAWVDGTISDTMGNMLFRNAGDWKFQNTTRASGTWGGGRSTFTAAWLDANNDNWPDLHVANEFGDGVLLVNRKDGTFFEQRLADRPADFGTMGLATGDINNDGTIDIYCANMYSKAGTRVIGNLPPGAYPPPVLEKMRRFVAGSQLHLNRGGLRFDQVGQEMQIASVGWAYGACLADLDSDGWLDLYATAGYISRSRTEPDG